MKKLIINISKKEDVINIQTENDIQYLFVKWNDNKLSINGEIFPFIDQFFEKVITNCHNIRIIDISNLDGYCLCNPSRFTKLEELYLPKTEDYVHIHEHRFLKKIRAIGAKRIYLNKMPNLDTLEFSQNLEEFHISEVAISQIIIPQNTKLDLKSIYKCDNLKKITINQGCFLGIGSIMECSNLEEVTLPEDLLLIAPRLFENCKKLKVIKGGRNIKQIFDGALANCSTSLERLDCLNFFMYYHPEYSTSSTEWMRLFNSKLSLTELLSKQKIYHKELKKRKINNKAKYLIENYFNVSIEHIGVFVRFFSSINRWAIWSFTNNKFYVSTNTWSTKKHFEYGDIVHFTENINPEIIIDEQINIFRDVFVVDLNKATHLKKNDESKEIDVKELFHFFKPQESYEEKFNKTVDFVNNLNIKSIIDSYKIEEESYWISRPGRDDHEHYKRVAKSDYSDIYLNSLLPQENIERYESGCRPWGASSYHNDDSEAKEIRRKARKNYSKTAHVCLLMKDFIDERHNLEIKIENKYNIKEILRYVNRISYVYKRDEYKFLSFLNKITLKEVLLNKERYIDHL